MMTIYVLNTQTESTKLRSSKLSIKSGDQKHIIEYGFERKFRDLKYFEVGFFLHSP